MAVQNRIVKVQKRNRALVKFDPERIQRAILRAAESIGGFQQDLLPGINDKIFDAHGADDKIAQFLAEAVVVCLNSDPNHLIANFPPTIEVIQDEVLLARAKADHQARVSRNPYVCPLPDDLEPPVKMSA